MKIAQGRRTRTPAWSAAMLAAIGAVLALTAVLPAGATAEQASHPESAAAGGIDVGTWHSCALAPPAVTGMRCWGYGGDGALGYGNTATIGDDETPAAAGPVPLGGHAAALGAGAAHGCAVLEDHTARCWGFGPDGRLGYGNPDSVGDDETPAAAGPVPVGGPVAAISAGRGHTCAVLLDGSVRCWGFANSGRLGYAGQSNVGDDETPAAAGPVDLGPGRTALAITAGDAHTCGLLADRRALCWGYGGNGELGYGTSDNLGVPASAPYTVGLNRADFAAISAGTYFTCAILTTPTRHVSCWGFGANGRLGTGTPTTYQGTPLDGQWAVDVGGTPVAISAGDAHACALIDGGAVRCWGFGGDGRLGYGDERTIGDDETPASVPPVDLGGRSAVAISAGYANTCARLDDDSVRCWGEGSSGRLGRCDSSAIGDDETPAAVAPVDLGAPGPRTDCLTAPAAQPPAAAPAAPAVRPAAPASPVARPSAATPAAASGPRRRWPARLRVDRARVRGGRLDVLVRLTTRARGTVRVRYRAGGRILSLRRPIVRGVVRITRRLAARQARRATGILEISYAGSALVRPDAVRLRAARRPAKLVVRTARISNRSLRLAGSISRSARGTVRVRLDYVDGENSRSLRYGARVRQGRWALARRLPAAAARVGGTLSIRYTGDRRRQVAGEQATRRLRVRR